MTPGVYTFSVTVAINTANAFCGGHDDVFIRAEAVTIGTCAHMEDNILGFTAGVTCNIGSSLNDSILRRLPSRRPLSQSLKTGGFRNMLVLKKLEINCFFQNFHVYCNRARRQQYDRLLVQSISNRDPSQRTFVVQVLLETYCFSK